ncbi:MAG: helix-turn-helix transcriptional regulator [Oscillospiraceae bacterium]|nr:helix-turn-helix transcriptional regulator [Oscillospiraceae bacterium]
MSIGKNISDLRREKGMTQQQLAEKLGVSAQSVSKWENGVCAPDVSQFPLLAELFGVSIDRIFGYRVSSREEAQALIDRADRCETLEENIAILQEGLEKDPASPELRVALAMSWLSLARVRAYAEKAEEADKARENCVRLCREVIRSCGDQAQVDGALEVLRRVYMDTGNCERALECVERMSPEAWQLRLTGKAQALLQRCDTELARFGERELWKLWLTMDQLISFMVSGFCQREDARRALAFAELREELLSLFDRGCPDFFASRKFLAADTCAKLLRAAEEREGCLNALRRQAAYGEQCRTGAETEDHRFAARNPLFFDRLGEDLEAQEEWVRFPDLPAFFRMYEEFLGDSEEYRALMLELVNIGS